MIPSVVAHEIACALQDFLATGFGPSNPPLALCGHYGHIHTGHGTANAACTSCGESEPVPAFCPETLTASANRTIPSRDCPFCNASEALIIVEAGLGDVRRTRLPLHHRTHLGAHPNGRRRRGRCRVRASPRNRVSTAAGALRAAPGTAPGNREGVAARHPAAHEGSRCLPPSCGTLAAFTPLLMRALNRLLALSVSHHIQCRNATRDCGFATSCVSSARSMKGMT